MVQLVVTPQRLTLGLGMTQHAGPEATALRVRFDRDGDGVIDEAEERELASWLDARGRRSLRLSLDGEDLQLEVVERQLTFAAALDAVEGDAIQLRSASVLAIGLRPGPHRIRLSDRPEGGRQLVPIRLDLPEGWTLSDVLAEGEAIPLSSAGEHSWQGAYAGKGGTLSFTIEVPRRREVTEQDTDDEDSSQGRGAIEVPSEVGSPSTGPQL